MSEWETKKLGEITDWFSGGTPSKQNETYWGGDIPWISAKTLKGTRVSESETLITEEGLKSGSRLALKDDLLLLVRGSGLFNSIPISIVDKPVAFNQDIKAIRLKKEYKHISPWFLLYWLHGNKRILNGIMEETGIGAGKFDLSLLKALTIDIPPQKELEEITKTVKIIDDKLTLLQKQNQTLEELAQTLFKRWFVEFEFPNENGQPYKSSVGKMVESELGEIPEGWSVRTIGDLSIEISDFVANGSFASLKENVTLYPDKEEYALFIRNTDLKSGFKDKVYVDEHSYNFLKKTKLFGGEVIISNVGDVGSVFQCPYFDFPMTLGNNVIMLKSDFNNFLYLFFSGRIGQYLIKGITGGSAQPKFNKTEFKTLEIPFPTENVLSDFEIQAESIFKKVTNNKQEVQSLTQLRDALLPKLMSGELKINSN
tara:strand:+ start:686 stop:1966 length:1281 start_codon:yes stop_codon:yes gene_type:complete